MKESQFLLKEGQRKSQQNSFLGGSGNTSVTGVEVDLGSGVSGGGLSLEAGY